MLNFLFTQTPLTFLTQSLWRDEAFTYFLAKKNVLEIISLSIKEFNPPLYYILLHFWMRLFGESEISLRTFSLIFYWLTIYVAITFLTEILKVDVRKRFLYFIFYILFFIVNPFLTYYAFEARNYTFFAFLATLSYYAFYKKNYKVYFFATTLGLYTHYFMVFVIFSQLLFNFLVKKKGRRYEIINKVIFKPLLIFLPWFLFILFQKNLFAASFWIQRININTLVSLLGVLYTGYDGGFRSYSIRATLISLTLFLLIIALLKLRNRKYVSDSQLFLYLGLWAIGIPLLVAVISLFKPIFYPRYFIFSAVGFLLLLVYILEQVKGGIRTLAIILLFMIAFNYQKIQIQHYKKRDFQKVVKEVKALAKKGDPIYVTSELDFFTAEYYFGENKVFVYSKAYDQIPDFVGKVLIPKEKVTSSLPVYPKRAFVLKSDGTYFVQALY